MVDVYVSTFKNKQRMFGNKKKIADDIVANPDSYHIYDGISAMTNISRFDLPDPQTVLHFCGALRGPHGRPQICGDKLT